MTELEGIPFGFHIYDLSRGIGSRFAESLVGTPLPQGVLHAALVIFGHEYFFEGGISKRPAGCTRFGKNFSYVPSAVPATAISSELELDVWVRATELSGCGMLAYSMTDHNCIEFCDRISLFLTNGKAHAPDVIRLNTAALSQTPVGALIFDIARLTSGIGMLKAAEQMHGRRQNFLSTFAIRKLLLGDGDDDSPAKSIEPAPLFCFGVSAYVQQQQQQQHGGSGGGRGGKKKPKHLAEATQSLIEFAFGNRAEERQISVERLKHLMMPHSSNNLMKSSSTAAAAASSSSPTSPQEQSQQQYNWAHMTATEACTLSTAIAQGFQRQRLFSSASGSTSFSNSPTAATLSASSSNNNSRQQQQIACRSFSDLSTLLALFTAYSIHEAFCLSVAHDLVLRNIVKRLVTHFFVVLPSALKVQVLEIMCNLIRQPTSAALFARGPSSTRSMMEFLISRSLLEPDSWAVVHRASCLLVNYTYAYAFSCVQSFDRDISGSKSRHHPVTRSVIIGAFVADTIVPSPLQCTTRHEDCVTPAAAAEMMREHPLVSVSKRLENELRVNQKEKNKNTNNDDDDDDDDQDSVASLSFDDDDDEDDGDFTSEFGRCRAPDVEDQRQQHHSTSRSAFFARLSPEEQNDVTNLIEVTQAVLENCVRAMTSLAMSGQFARGLLARHACVPDVQQLKHKAGNDRVSKLLQELSLIL